jgi:hypothetical protein
VIPVSAIIAAMCDVRPGRFYSVDELAAALHVEDRGALREQLRALARDTDADNPFRISQGGSDEFYRRIPRVRHTA